MDEDVGGKLSFAPIEVEKVRRAMDVGTGTGELLQNYRGFHVSCPYAVCPKGSPQG